MVSLLCITKAEPFALPFLHQMSILADLLKTEFILAVDAPIESYLQKVRTIVATQYVAVQSAGYLESVHDMVLTHCTGRYVLRLDDDEAVSPAMERWLVAREYLSAPHWKFPRAHLFGSRDRVLMHPQLWPDHQTRLSLKSMAGGRNHIHAGSPFGGGAEAPVVIEHWKYLVKTIEERREIAARYDSIQMGAGTGGMLAFNVPEDCGPQVTAPLGDGTAADIRHEHGIRVELL